jgi:hypothetical protein
MARGKHVQYRILVVLLGASFALCAAAQDKPHPTAATAAKMRASVERLLAALPHESREQAVRPFEDRDRIEWHYTLRSRNGLALKDMDKPGREATHALLRAALSTAGYRKAANIIELEIVLREIEMFGWMRDPERYYLTVYGTPDRAKPWGLALRGPSPVAQFHAGWTLLDSLNDAQRREAMFETRTYGDIVTRNRDKVAPLDAVGIPVAKLDAKQRGLLWKLIETYAASFEPGLARARLARAKQGGFEALRFGWAGSTTRGKPHYYRVQGKLFLIEYDASQDDGNHIHTVWRDFSGDFGRDLLREHYSLARGTSHRH